jgi:hypothetical protein
LDANAVLFQGDLPLRIGFEVHAVSARRGLVRSPGFATAAASLRADFTDAGLFFRLEDLFDRRPPSGAYEITTDDGIPLPGRLLRVGVVWHLLD